MIIIMCGCLALYLHVFYLSFGKTTEQAWAVMVDTEGRDRSKICPCCFSPKTEPQSLVGVWKMKNEEDVLLRLSAGLRWIFFI